MKYLFILLFLPLFSIAQTKKIPHIEGYKILKIGSILDKSKVVADEKQFDGTEKWLVSDTALLHYGYMFFNKILVTTFDDTIKVVRLVSDYTGRSLFSDYQKKYGQPIEKTLNKYKSIETATWKTGNTQIFFFTPEGSSTSTCVYSDIKFLEMMERKKLESL